MNLKNNLIIDVGCGNSPKGYVNLDKCFNINKYINKGIEMNPKNYKNFIIADAENLPIKNSCFEIVYSSHLIEHILIPSKALKEFNRISKNIIIIIIPKSIDNVSSEHPTHLYSWNYLTFKNLLEMFFNDVKIIENYNININYNDRKIFKILKYIPFGKKILEKLIYIFFVNELIGVCKK